MIKEFKFEGKNLRLNLPGDADLSVFEEIFVDRDYRILDEVIRKAKSCVLDLGAHVGLFSLYARGIGCDVPIFAFEPEESNFQILKENLKMNNVKDVVAKNLAVGGKSGKRRFYLSLDSHNHSLVEVGENLQEREVSVVTLQDVFERYLGRDGINKCDLVKMDIEGAEFETLMSYFDCFVYRPQGFYIEYHEYSDEMKAEKLKGLFEKHGFRVQMSSSHYDKRMGFLFAMKK